ncbi:POLLUX, partial [Symbiodinium microadriaticum]
MDTIAPQAEFAAPCVAETRAWLDASVPALIFLGVWFMVLNQIVRIVWQERFREAEYSLEALQRFLVDWDTARCGHVVGVVVSIGGMLIFALLLSLITSSFEEFLWHLRHGSIPVVEGDHIVILGYDSSAVIMIE